MRLEFVREKFPQSGWLRTNREGFLGRLKCLWTHPSTKVISSKNSSNVEWLINLLLPRVGFVVSSGYRMSITDLVITNLLFKLLFYLEPLVLNLTLLTVSTKIPTEQQHTSTLLLLVSQCVDHRYILHFFKYSLDIKCPMFEAISNFLVHFKTQTWINCIMLIAQNA